MASKRKAFLSRSVSLSLAALIVLTGAMFLITTLEQDHQEWVLVEDQVMEFYSISMNDSATAQSNSDYLTEFAFEEDTSSYHLTVSEGSKSASTSRTRYFFAFDDNFDYSKQYKISVSSGLPLYAFACRDSVDVSTLFSLRSVASDDDGVYHSDIIILDQIVTDLSFKDFIIFLINDGSETATYAANDFVIQLYELHDDNAGSIAAAITGLTLIVMGVFATPMLNVFRRR